MVDRITAFVDGPFMIELLKTARLGLLALVVGWLCAWHAVGVCQVPDQGDCKLKASGKDGYVVQDCGKPPQGVSCAPI